MDSLSLAERKQHYSIWGKTFIIAGAIPLSFGLGYILLVLATPVAYNCPGIPSGTTPAPCGPSPLTPYQFVQNFWPELALIALGLVLILIGIGYITKARSFEAITKSSISQ